jgi:AraC-like DNA-binding protein
MESRNAESKLPDRMADGQTVHRLVRAPGPELRAFVQTLWAVDAPVRARTEREHVLPTGQIHLVFRSGGGDLRLFADGADTEGHPAGDALIGGARDGYYARVVAGAQCSVGAQLRPGAAEALFGAPAGEFTNRHTSLDDVWGGQVGIMRERLSEVSSLEERVSVLENILAARVRKTRGIHPSVAQALRQFTVTSDVSHVVRESGFSHRTLISEFRRSVGLTPKEYTRVLRLQRAIRGISEVGTLADLAAAAGYSDQAHLCREFREFTGVTPGEYRHASPDAPHHLTIA